MAYENLSGQRFGRLKALSRVEGVKPTTWIFLCDCGSKKKLYSTNVKSGNTKSCGCFNKELKTTHGGSCHKLYKTWEGMVARCYDTNTDSYKNYGGRGIKVCNQWLKSPITFFNDMGERPKGYTIDRIDNNGNYEPVNCRWASNLEQGSNRRNNYMVELNGKFMHLAEASRITGIPNTTLKRAAKKGCDISSIKRSRNVIIEFNGESMTMKDWAKKIGIKYYTLKYRITSGWAVCDALTLPVNN